MASEEMPAESTAHILVIEDDADLSVMLSGYFKIQGYRLSVAQWGEDGLQLALREQPDLILLDIRLPDISGYEVCRRLRQQRQTAEIPVIFLTERREREDMLTGLELGAVDYITKPFDVQELRLRVRNVLRRARQEPLLNGVTGLPEGDMVREKLAETTRRDDWGMVVTSLGGLKQFRDRYGFVAADDAARAICLMLKSAAKEAGAADAFLGHLGPSDFVLLTTRAKSQAIAERAGAALAASIQYFYPETEREESMARPEAQRLYVRTGTLTAEAGPFVDLTALRAALLAQVRT